MPRTCLLLSMLSFLTLVISAQAARAQEQTPTAAPSETPVASPTLPRPEGTAELLIRSPLPGQALQGSLNITGSNAVAGFASAEVSFAYAGDQMGTWFLIGEASQPIQDGTLAQWDTSSITDGDYDLRLRVKREDGSHLDVVVSGLRVRNYTPVETDTPTPVTPTATPMPGELPVTATLTPVSLPSATPLPTNPAVITSQDIALGLGKGALAVIALFALMGVYRLVTGISSGE